MPFRWTPEEYDRAAVPHQRSRLLHGEENAAGVDAEGLIEMLRRHGRHRRGLDEAGARDHDVEAALLHPYLAVEAIEIVQLCDVALHGRDVAPHRGFGLVELRLTAPEDEHIGAFINKSRRRGEADSAAAAGDDSDFSIQLAHDPTL
jgi:hypothetical protein